MNAHTPKRAETLRINCFIFGTVKEPPREALEASWPLLYAEERGMYVEGSVEDVHLANACLELAADLRRRQWAALETLLPLLAAEDEWDERRWQKRLEDLPEPDFLPAARAALTLGWITGWT